MQFKIVRNGYDTTEVTKYINNQEMSYSLQCDKQKDRIKELLQQNEELKAKVEDYNKKEESISNALMQAVDKAKQIEEGSKRIYELEIQKIRLLFNKYKTFLDDLIQNQTDVKSIKTTKALIEDFKNSINSTINSSFNVGTKTVSAYDPMRALLGKMNSYMAQRNSQDTELVAHSQTTKPQALRKGEEREEINDFSFDDIKLKPIVDTELTETDDYDNIVDKFLAVGDEKSNGLTKQFEAEKEPTNNGFDLKEAVNPKDSLEEILKCFDLD